MLGLKTGFATQKMGVNLVLLKKTFFFANQIKYFQSRCSSTHSGLQFHIRIMGSKLGLNMGFACRKIEKMQNFDPCLVYQMKMNKAFNRMVGRVGSGLGSE
jgi:hypothetical protein